MCYSDVSLGISQIVKHQKHTVFNTNSKLYYKPLNSKSLTTWGSFVPIQQKTKAISCSESFKISREAQILNTEQETKTKCHFVHYNTQTKGTHGNPFSVHLSQSCITGQQECCPPKYVNFMFPQISKLLRGGTYTSLWQKDVGSCGAGLSL